MDEGYGAWIGTNQAPRMEVCRGKSAATWSSRGNSAADSGGPCWVWAARGRPDS